MAGKLTKKDLLDFGGIVFGGIGEYILCNSLIDTVVDTKNPAVKIGLGVIKTAATLDGMKRGVQLVDTAFELKDRWADAYKKVKAESKNETPNESAPDATDKFDDDLF